MKEEPVNLGFSKSPTKKRQKYINNGKRATIKQMAELDEKFRMTGVIQNEIDGEKNMLNQIELVKATTFVQAANGSSKSMKSKKASAKFNDQTKKDVKLNINQSEEMADE